MRYRNLVLISLMTGLFGCASQVEYVDRPIYVDRVVPVPCINASDIPAKPIFAVTLLQRNSNADTVTKAYMVERRQRITYEAKLEAVLNACIERPALGAGGAQ